MDYSTISADELALTCFRTGDESAWVEFVRRFHPLIARVVLRVARQWGETSAQVIDDLIQDTYLKLCADRLRALQNFKSAHKDAIYGYIKVITANLVHDHFKNARSLKRGGGTTAASIDGRERGEMLPTAVSAPAALDRYVLIREIDARLKLVAAGPEWERDRQIFWLYYRVGLTASAIAALPKIGLGAKGVESVLLRLTREVRQQLAPDSGRASDSDRLEGIRPAESL